MPSTLGNLRTFRLAVEICEGTIPVTYITTRKMHYRTPFHPEGECLLWYVLQGILVLKH